MQPETVSSWGVNEDGSVVTWAPRLDVHEGKDAYGVSVDLPGVEKKDIELSLEAGVLSLRGERRTVAASDEDGWHRVERHSGAFQRTLNLGDGVDENGVKAEFKDGVLTVTVPKKEAAKARSIEIR